MKTEKKQWTKPQLVILGRGTPEERVLATCKHMNGIGSTDAGSTKGNCHGGIDTNCSVCTLEAYS